MKSAEVPQLNLLLERATTGGREAQHAFFQCLLNSSVFVPLGKTRVASVAVADAHQFAAVKLDGRPTVPVFTDTQCFEEWSDGSERELLEKEFPTLLRLIQPDVWLHLNPGSEYGKEFSPWEIELLRKGPAAIDDILDDQESLAPGDLEVSGETDRTRTLKAVLRPIIELNPEIEEAFVSEVIHPENEKPSFLVGLNQSGLSAARTDYIRDELNAAASAHLPPGELLVLAPDLSDPKSPNWTFFTGLTPFYFASRGFPAKEDRGAVLPKGLRRLFGSFTGKR